MAVRAAQPGGLVGRRAESIAAQAALRLRSGGGVLIVGEPGIGKTRLARAVLDEVAEDSSYDILWLVASASEPPIPFGAFAPFVPEIGGLPGAQPDPFYLLQTLRRAIVARAGGRRLVLGVDDAHRLDGHSATLLFQLVATESTGAVVAMRSGWPGPEAVRGLWKEGLLDRIDLGPLGYEEALELAASDLGEPDSAPLGTELAEALWRVGHGNPLYLRELVRVGCEAGRIVKERDVWRLRGELTVGPRLTELVHERLGNIGADDMAALEVIAFADPVPLKVLNRLIPPAEVSSLERQGLLKVERSQGEHVVRTAHPLYGEAIRAAIPSSRATELGAKLADAFEADGRMATQVLRIVSWRLDAGTEPGAGQLVAASLQAAERQDWELSRRLAEAAVSAGGGPEAVFALADALRTLGRAEEALAVLGHSRGNGDDQIARVAVLRAFILFWGLGRFAEADAALNTARLRIAGESDRTWVEAVQAGMRNFAGRPMEAVAMARPLLARRGLTPRTEITVRSVLSMGLGWSGRPEEAIEVAEECMRPALQGTGSSLSVAWTLAAHALAYRMSGRMRELENLAASQYRLAVQLNDRQTLGAAAAGLGWVALPRGELSSATAWFRHALAALEGGDSIGGRVLAFAGLAEALAISGDAEGAEAVLVEASGLLAPGPHGPTVVAPRLGVSAAWVAAAKGEMSRALSLLTEAADDARRSGQIGYEMMALNAAVRLGSPVPAARLTELDDWFEGPLISVVAAHAAALGLSSEAGSGEALDEVTQRYSSLTLNLYAAEASAQASRAHGLAGKSRQAAAAASRSFFLVAGHEGRRPLSLEMALTPPALTRREKEVALLAVRGLSSQAIANRLCVSVRTVDSHLARVYYKLGISGRAHLADALDPAGVAPDGLVGVS